MTATSSDVTGVFVLPIRFVVDHVETLVYVQIHRGLKVERTLNRFHPVLLPLKRLSMTSHFL